MGLVVVHPFLLAREPSAAEEAHLRNAVAAYKLLLIATIYMPPPLCGRFAVEI